MLSRTFVALAASSLAVACGDSVSPGPGGPDSADRADAAGIHDARVDSSCHIDCFGRHECSDGVVTTWAHRPIPCSEAETCPSSETYTCARGCRNDVESTGYAEEPWSMCEEFRPKQAGDPCTEPAHCDPQVAEYDYESGEVTNVYLRCDTRLGECVEREPPVVEDFWQPSCGLEPNPDTPVSFGVVDSELCSGGKCVMVDDGTCVRQGCTITCDSDDECPVGSTCHDFQNVCILGWWTSLTEGLVCPE